jgi:hypothetical protein
VRVVDLDLHEAMAGQHIFFGIHQPPVGTQLHLGLAERAVREKRYRCAGLVHRSGIAHNPLTG